VRCRCVAASQLGTISDCKQMALHGTQQDQVRSPLRAEAPLPSEAAAFLAPHVRCVIPGAGSADDVDSDPSTVTAFCVGDLWLGVSHILRDAANAGTATGADVGLAAAIKMVASDSDYLQDLLVYASADRFIRFELLHDPGSPSPGADAGARRLADSGLLSAIRLVPADSTCVVGLAAVGARQSRGYSELVALEENGSVTIFLGLQVCVSQPGAGVVVERTWLRAGCVPGKLRVRKHSRVVDSSTAFLPTWHLRNMSPPHTATLTCFPLFWSLVCA
jgi:hypothetical protein